MDVFVWLFVWYEPLITLPVECQIMAVIFQYFNSKIELVFWFQKFFIDYEDIDVIYNSLQTPTELSEEDKQYLKERELIQQIEELFEGSST